MMNKVLLIPPLSVCIIVLCSILYFIFSSNQPLEYNSDFRQFKSPKNTENKAPIKKKSVLLAKDYAEDIKRVSKRPLFSYNRRSSIEQKILQHSEPPFDNILDKELNLTVDNSMLLYKGFIHYGNKIQALIQDENDGEEKWVMNNGNYKGWTVKEISEKKLFLTKNGKEYVLEYK